MVYILGILVLFWCKNNRPPRLPLKLQISTSHWRFEGPEMLFGTALPFSYSVIMNINLCNGYTFICLHSFIILVIIRLPWCNISKGQFHPGVGSRTKRQALENIVQQINASFPVVVCTSEECDVLQYEATGVGGMWECSNWKVADGILWQTQVITAALPHF